jgi:hypothetical protein
VGKINERSRGAVTVSAGNIINPANAVGTTTVTNGGTFSLHARNSTITPDATNQANVGSSLGGAALTFAIAIK